VKSKKHKNLEDWSRFNRSGDGHGCDACCHFGGFYRAKPCFSIPLQKERTARDQIRPFEECSNRPSTRQSNATIIDQSLKSRQVYGALDGVNGDARYGFELISRV
jgi:hypothetical protein